MKNKVFFNPMIRYTLLNCLKYNIIAMTTIMHNSESLMEVGFAIILIILFLILPTFYAYFLKSRKEELDDA